MTSTVRAVDGHPLAPGRADLIRAGAFVGGRWMTAERRFTVTDPATGEPIAEVSDGDAAVANAATDAAVAAYPAWRALTGAARGKLLRRWYELVIAHGEDLARLMSWEQGKPLAEARGELAYSAGYLEWFAEEARRAYGDILPSPVGGRETMVFKEPVGVCALITPWNFPMAMIARKFAPALAAGCTVVAKPAAETPLTALALVALAEEAGFPAGTVNIVPSSRASVVAGAWMEDPRIRKVSFTGSTAVGKQLMRQGAETMKRLSLELGGDAPFLVFDDADIEIALAGLIKAKFRNAGQACIAANRIYVQAGIHDAFVERLVPMVRALSVGAAASGAHDIGPLINARAAAGTKALVDDAVAAGARVLQGGRPHALGGLFYEPTVLTDVTADMDVCRREIFGPVVAVAKFVDEAGAIASANASDYGLAGYVFSTDVKRIWRVMRALECGVVGVNEGAVSTEVAPFGGMKQSGYGREGSRYGLADYQNIKYVCMGGLD